MKHVLLLLMAVVVIASCQQQNIGQVVLNEICGKDADGLEWIEVGNASSVPINLSGYKLVKMDENGLDKTLYKFGDTLLAAGAIMTVNAELLKAHVPNKKQAIIELLDPEGNVVDAFDSNEDLDVQGHADGASYARIPNIVGEWTLCERATWDAPNQEISQGDQGLLDFDDAEDPIE